MSPSLAAVHRLTARLYSRHRLIHLHRCSRIVSLPGIFGSPSQRLPHFTLLRHDLLDNQARPRGFSNGFEAANAAADALVRLGTPEATTALRQACLSIDPETTLPAGLSARLARLAQEQDGPGEPLGWPWVGETAGLDGHGIYYVSGLLKHYTTAQTNALICPRAHPSRAGIRDKLAPPAGLDRIDAALREEYARAGMPARCQLLRYRGGHFETWDMRCRILEFLRRLL